MTIAKIENLPDDIIGYTYNGEVTAADYESVLFPAVEAAVKKSKNLKVLCQLGDDFKHFNFGALKDDLELGLKYFKDWKKVAFVSDKEWMNHTVKAFSFLVPAKVKIFENKDMDEAVKWLSE
jgi:hypothetical protein